MGDEVRPSDIVDLKEADKILHERITMSQNKHAETLAAVGIKQAEVQKDIQDLLLPFGSMGTQVATNKEDIGKVEDAIKTRDNRAWAFVLMLLIEMAMIIYQINTTG